MPIPLARIATAVIGTEFEKRVYLVGGAVRDELLGRAASGDFDLVVEGDALALAEHLHAAGVAKSVPVTYPRFGTAMLFVGGATVELVSARKESYDSGSRKPHVAPASLLEDARRRDFTVNTLLKDISTGEVIDPLGTGLADLEARVLRTPLDPDKTFAEDPLRILRAIRFRWQLGFDFSPGVEAALTRQAQNLRTISDERIRDEFSKTVLLPGADCALEDLLRLGVLLEFLPEFLPMVGCEQGGYHHLDVWGHTLLALKNCRSNDLLTRLAVLFHDIGKPSTQSEGSGGARRFLGHETVGEEMTLSALRRLKFSGSDAGAVAQLVKNHMRLCSMPKLTQPAARRIVRDLGDHLDRWLDVIDADASALKPGIRELDIDSVREFLAETAAHTPARALGSPLNGREISEETGEAPGPMLGRLKALLSEDVVEGRLAPGDKAAARGLLAEHYRNARSAVPVTVETKDE